MVILSVVKRNIISNLLGKGLSAVLSFVFVPFYLKYLGAEAYGLIGIYVFLQSVFMVADMGLSGTFSRETARLSAQQDMEQQLCDLCRTFELLFAGIGISAAIIIMALSHHIAEYWVKPNTLTVESVSVTIVLIGITAGLQFPFFIYQGGMQGLQRQTLLNLLMVVVGLMRGLGALWILAFITPTIQAFFLWQIIVNLIQLVIGYVMIWRNMPSTALPARFNLKLIVPLWRFAAGMAGITLSGILLTQVDKLILSKMLTLENFGYYTLATVVAGIPGIISFPIFNAVYPRFTQLVAMQNFTELTDLYHRSCQLLAVLLLPVGLVLSFFSSEIMLLWTGNMQTAKITCQLVSVLVIGSTMMGLMMMPYAIQLAFAWTRLSLIFNYASVIFLVPLMIWLIPIYGVMSAGITWLLLDAIYLTGMIHLMHFRILPGEKANWYIDDLIKPFCSALLIAFLGRWYIDEHLTKTSMVASLALVLFISVLSAAFSVKYIRRAFTAKVGRILGQLACNIR